eukprot:gene41813-51036_t
MRGARGRGWFYQYKESPESFEKYTRPTPFDWQAQNDFCNPAIRPTATFTLASSNEPLGTLEIELARDIVPRTVDNFVKLVTGDNAFQRCYKGTKVHRIQKGVAIMMGDVVHNDGSGSHSAVSRQFFKDENFIIPHSARGLVSMASIGVNTNGSQFYLSLSPSPHMNGRCTVFGRLKGGEEVLSRLEKVFTVRRIPVTDIVVTSCTIQEPKP